MEKELLENLAQFQDACAQDFPCRVCQGQTEEVEVIHDCRVGHILMTERPCSIQTEDFVLYRCPRCSHFQIVDSLPNGYYESYVPGTGQQQYSGTLNKLEEKIKRLHGYSPSDHSVVEIGCGDITSESAAYRIAATLYRKYVGVDSSAEECQPAMQAGLPVVQGYFGPELDLPDGFSSFMTFQAFEYLDDLYGVLDYALELLVPGGVGLINVPNGRQIMEENLYHQVIAEHINYFTPESLVQMAKRAGYEIIELRAVPETIELDLYVRKPVPRNASMDQARRSQQQTLHTQLAGCRCIGVWGAGGKAPIYGSLLSKNLPIGHLFDSNPEKAGKYIGCLPVPVEPVSADALEDCDAVLIFASSYNEEIIKSLRENFHYRKKIVYFEGADVKYC